MSSSLLHHVFRPAHWSILRRRLSTAPTQSLSPQSTASSSSSSPSLLLVGLASSTTFALSTPARSRRSNTTSGPSPHYPSRVDLTDRGSRSLSCRRRLLLGHFHGRPCLAQQMTTLRGVVTTSPEADATPSDASGPTTNAEDQGVR